MKRRNFLKRVAIAPLALVAPKLFAASKPKYIPIPLTSSTVAPPKDGLAHIVSMSTIKDGDYNKTLLHFRKDGYKDLKKIARVGGISLAVSNSNGKTEMAFQIAKKMEEAAVDYDFFERGKNTHRVDWFEFKTHQMNAFVVDLERLKANDS